MLLLLLILNNFTKIFITLQSSVIADTFVITFIYRIRHHIVLRFHNIQDIITEGRVQNPQRFERCITMLQDYVKPAIEVMYERRRPVFEYTLGDFERKQRVANEIYSSAKVLAQECFDTYSGIFMAKNNLPLDVSVKVLKKLKTARILIGFTDEILRMDELEEYYKELDLRGDESFLTSMLAMDDNSWKVNSEPKGSKRKSIEDILIDDKQPMYKMEAGNYYCEIFFKLIRKFLIKFYFLIFLIFFKYI
jgi:hypothetical protein